ncbi:hypothetical protein BJ912DRAFT_982132 [Pholiota molesta]|nr:hypothetical protein BJ912DRAFT_982132 [Pholiota molesta]
MLPPSCRPRRHPHLLPMSSNAAPPLRSAMKHPMATMSPEASRIPLPSQYSSSPSPMSTPAYPPTQTPTGSLTRSESSAFSPPPVPHHMSSTHYTPKVSFDTFENPVASMFSFTLQAKTEGYKRTRNTRVFLCASSPDESGREALDWCLESLVQEGDELIVFRGADEDVFEKDHNLVREEARELMRTIQDKSTEYGPERKLSLILEYIPGKVTDTIDRLIALYRPDSLVVGTRGRRFGVGLVQGLSVGLVQGLGGASIGSVSKYCLSHSPVPVIVVRPGRKLRKAVEKRRADPKRGKHFE